LQLRSHDLSHQVRLIEEKMSKSVAFSFLDVDLNRRLIAIAEKSDIAHSVDPTGALRFRVEDEAAVENNIIGAVRKHAFRSWQVLSCPPESLPLYRDYMKRRSIPFVEESMDGEVSFLLSGRYRPHSWKLEPTVDKSRLSRVG
jgi:hypothetical protein